MDKKYHDDDDKLIESQNVRPWKVNINIKAPSVLFPFFSTLSGYTFRVEPEAAGGSCLCPVLYLLLTGFFFLYFV